MRGFLAALVIGLAIAGPATACFVPGVPKPDHLQMADTVALAVLLKAEHGPYAKHADNFGVRRTAFLTFKTARTYKGPHRDEWRVIWRGGDPDRVHNNESSTAAIGHSYIVGIVPAEMQWGMGCHRQGDGNCFADGADGFHPELLDHPCSPGGGYAFAFSDELEQQVLKLLSEGK
ncbi:MAG TPA: hypothetical protein VLA52_07250 [Thermohalobaculum sp.]|nr:hypothetical protein [Thermohalobaculum sp.]